MAWPYHGMRSAAHRREPVSIAGTLPAKRLSDLQPFWQRVRAGVKDVRIHDLLTPFHLRPALRVAGTDSRSDMKDFGPSCFHSPSTGAGNANAAPEGGAKAFDTRFGIWLRE